VNAIELQELTRVALEIIGLPEWESVTPTGAPEQLFFLPGSETEPPLWVVGRPDKPEESVIVAPGMAAALIGAHLRAWLSSGGWQVQLAHRGGRPRWRLADVLAPLDGGGDRLECDYPSGEDEVGVLCASVLAVARKM
jgi:hypothetical protein